jgi:tetratricopeptide (TPR) repeat protein
MPSGPAGYDFFLSRRGSVAAVAREVENALGEKGYRVLTQDYDIPLGTSFIEKMHEAVSNSRDLVILFTHDYLDSPLTRKEFTSFEAERAQSQEDRHIIVLRCEDVPLRGLLADNVYQDLVGVVDSEERRRRIVAAAERQSQAAPPPPRPFIGVPPRIASFTGRADELDRLDAALMQERPAAVTQASVGRAAVQGMGGVGKTSLAIEYAHRYRSLYAGVYWCPAEARMGLLSALASLAVMLGAATAEEADVEKAANAALRRLAEQRATWLLVYDNVPEPKDIAELLPSAGARVLITSRFSDWSELADEVALDVLPSDHAVALLERRTRRSDAVGAEALAEALGRLPLALDHAAAYCKRTQMRFAAYAAKALSLITSVPRGAGYPRSVRATFDLAISQAVAQCTSAEALMAFLAQCGPERIPMSLVEGAVENEGELLQALSALVEVSLVKHDPFEDGAEAVTVHRLVQAVAGARSEANGSWHDAVGRLIARLVTIYPKESYSDWRLWPLCAQLTPHLLARRHAWGDGTWVCGNSCELLDRAGSYFHGRAAYSQAAPLFHDALAMREKGLGPEHPDTATSLNNLALLFQDQGNYVQARLLHERALAIQLKALGPQHPQTASSLHNLACLLHNQGNFAQARLLQERALAIQEKVLGVEHPETASSLYDLTFMLKDQGDFAGAQPLEERALERLEKGQQLHPEDPNTAQNLNRLAALLYDQRDFIRARLLYERALAIREKALGPEHPDTGTSLHNLAGVLYVQRDIVRARLLYERALAIREKALGPEHPTTNITRCKLSNVLLRAGSPTEALTLGGTALKTQCKILGWDHPWTKDSARVTADALEALGRLEEAKEQRRRYGLPAQDK